jgi:hypothetical protein
MACEAVSFHLQIDKWFTESFILCITRPRSSDLGRACSSPPSTGQTAKENSGSVMIAAGGHCGRPRGWAKKRRDRRAYLRLSGQRLDQRRDVPRFAETIFRNSLAARPGGRCFGQTVTIFRSGLGD